MRRRHFRRGVAPPLVTALLVVLAALSAANCNLLPKHGPLVQRLIGSRQQTLTERVSAMAVRQEQERQSAARDSRRSKGAARGVAATATDWAAPAPALVPIDDGLLPPQSALPQQAAGDSQSAQRGGAHHARLVQRALREGATGTFARQRSTARRHGPAAFGRRSAQPSPATATAAQRAAIRRTQAMQRARTQQGSHASKRKISRQPASRPRVSRRGASDSPHPSSKQAQGTHRAARRPPKPRPVQHAKPDVKAAISLNGGGGPASGEAKTHATTAPLVQRQPPSSKV